MSALCNCLLLSACAVAPLLALAAAEGEVCTSADDGTSTCASPDTHVDEDRSLGIAFVGNSLTYYNDLPHLVQSLLSAGFAGSSMRVGACLRGGAGLPELWEQGARVEDRRHIGGRDMYDTVEALLSAKPGWDVVVLQDHSQGPARESMRERSVDFLSRFYAPLLSSAGRRPLMVLLYESWGYSRDIGQSEELGDFHEMTRKVEQGYRSYAEALIRAGLQVAPVSAGKAFAALYDRAPELWQKLYDADALHPSALGTFLVGAHMATTIAELPLFAPLFPGTLPFHPTWPVEVAWPAEVGIYESQGAPTAEDLSAVLRLAGPEAFSDRPAADRRPAGDSEPACFDLPGWRSSDEHTCSDFVSKGWCTSSGDYGEGWEDSWGTFGDYRRFGHDATVACCGCGRGRRARRAPPAEELRRRPPQQEPGLPAGPEQSGRKPPEGLTTLVRCATTTGSIAIEVNSDWAPNGAKRFLDMVQSGFFSTKVALFRSVKGFICQTGVAGDPEVQREWKAKGNIEDDPQWLDGREPQRMKRGYLSFAGGGTNSRSVEFFFTFRDIDLGTSPWEVPFAKLVGEESYLSMDRWYTGYGDVPAFGGRAPDQGRMYQEGVVYVEEGFPEMDYITACSVE